MSHHPSPETDHSQATPDRWTDKFEKMAEKNPSLAAVTSGTDSLTYGQLNTRSEQIAKLLRSHGIGHGHFVGLALHRCINLPAALLGIMKAGAAYVPIDPGYPTARIEQMISAAKLEYVVTHAELAGEFPGVRSICVDDLSISDLSPAGSARSPENDVLTNAIITTVSTSQPKAANVFHPGFENLLHWYSIELKLGPSDRTLVISPPSFDLTRKNFFAPLSSGGTLILDDCKTYDVSRITSLIRQHSITLINCTPSAFYPLVDAAATDHYAGLSSLRFAVLTGEPISISRLRAWLEHASCRAEVVNSYGPTECTEIRAFQRLHRGNLDDHSFATPGRELPNVKGSILDGSQAPLPNGDIGERCIPDTGIGAGRLHFVENIALGPNGQIDHLALAGPAAFSTDRNGPGGAMESKILALWSEVLDHPVSDATTNFFDLGGNSIHVAVIHVRLMEMVGRKFPITELFALPSARAIAEHLAIRDPAVSRIGHHDRARLAHIGFSRFRNSITK